ncbi:unnamed protein product [Protopolystoma xenopodis]|uniref:Uncharacterized protein n=1 Tax=Protopolystoma xenopodis TaxID=117903 RepID=A0A448WWT8_9PLAT|nr:unnamed protein product [Protopolystoma xenopodis]
MSLGVCECLQLCASMRVRKSHVPKALSSETWPGCPRRSSQASAGTSVAGSWRSVHQRNVRAGVQLSVRKTVYSNVAESVTNMDGKTSGSSIYPNAFFRPWGRPPPAVWLTPPVYISQHPFGPPLSRSRTTSV